MGLAGLHALKRLLQSRQQAKCQPAREPETEFLACWRVQAQQQAILSVDMADIELVSIDQEKDRLHKVKENLERLQLHAHLKCADLTAINTWWNEKLFDRILLDAPCSASGIVARHPDIPFLRREADIKSLQQKQRGILEQAWKMLRPEGLMLYVTCSLFPEEGEEQASWFAGEHSNAVRLDAPGQILPTDVSDGFYYALFKKNGP